MVGSAARSPRSAGVIAVLGRGSCSAGVLLFRRDPRRDRQRGLPGVHRAARGCVGCDRLHRADVGCTGLVGAVVAGIGVAALSPARSRRRRHRAERVLSGCPRTHRREQVTAARASAPMHGDGHGRAPRSAPPPAGCVSQEHARQRSRQREEPTARPRRQVDHLADHLGDRSAASVPCGCQRLRRSPPGFLSPRRRGTAAPVTIPRATGRRWCGQPRRPSAPRLPTRHMAPTTS